MVWKAIARQMGPQALRMNLNTLVRHEVLGNGREDREMVDYVAGRIADAEAIRRSRQFPYQFLAAYLNASAEVPQKIKAALHQAAEIACGNVPELPGPVVIGLDTSGSMGCPVTGYRGRGATTKMRCVDVAALFAAAILRRNPDSVVIPFDTRAYGVRVDPGDTILSLSERLAQLRRRWNRLLDPAARGQHEAPQAGVCRLRAGQRQRELGVPQPCVRVRSPRCNGRHGRVADVRGEPEAAGRQLAEAGLHRHPAVRIDAGTGACRHPEHRRLLGRRVQRGRLVPGRRRRKVRRRSRVDRAVNETPLA